MKLLRPVPDNAYVTQTYQQHVDRAINNGWCYMPSPCPGGVYYYGGIDWGLPEGMLIVATMDGTVSVAKVNTGGYGIHVKIEHAGGLLSVYGHLSELMVSVGNTVKCGDVVGLSGNTGNSTGPHLHFEMRQDGIPFDPFPYLVSECEDSTPTPMPEFPQLPIGQVVVSPNTWLNIREQPTTSSRKIGKLYTGDLIEVIRAETTNNDIWLQIGNKQWTAMLYGGSEYVKWYEN
jgi:uncharacterized protein YgiM (DUF1202 family)